MVAGTSNLEAYTLRSLEKTLRDGGLSVRIMEPGQNEFATTSDEEWIEVHVLSVNPINTRAQRWAGSWLIQITCYSKTANVRSDGDRTNPWKIAGLVRTLLQPETGKGIMIQQLGGDSSAIAVMTFPRIEMAYLPSNSAGLEAGAGVPPTPSNLHAVVLTCTGVMVA